MCRPLVVICVNGLIVILFISCCESCAWLSGTCLVFHVAVVTAETHHPLPVCATSLLGVITIQQASVSVTAVLFFLSHGWWSDCGTVKDCGILILGAN